jgi:two-component system sensor histidine kinase HydH
MSSVMAHELRNPLASLKGHAQLLAEDLTDEKQKKKADRVVADAQRLEALTTSLLDFVRDGPIETERVPLQRVLDRALEDLDRARVDVRGEGVVLADELRLARALHNVLDNALKASPSDARVELTVQQEGSELVIAVRDHGEGLPADAQIFEPFVTTRTRGTGLGLPVARRIAEQHGGSLNAENDPAGGAVFTFRLPHASQA